MKRFLFFSILLFMAVAAYTVQKNKPKATPPEQQARTVAMDGINWKKYKIGNQNLMSWEKGTITERDTVFTADRIEVVLNDRDEAQTGKATGHLRIINPEHDLTGDLITIDFSKKVASVVGNVRMIVKPKPGGEGDDSVRSRLKDRAVLTCDRMDYYYRQKRGEAYDSLKVTQRVRNRKNGEEFDRIITGDKGVYTEKTEQVVVTGNPVRYRDIKGEDIRNDVTTPGPVTSSVKEDEEEQTETPPAEVPPTNPGSGEGRG